MNCPNCHSTNRESARFCRRCGLWLEHACPNCGQHLPETPIFCDQCGYQVSRIAAVGSPPAAPLNQAMTPGLTDSPSGDPQTAGGDHAQAGTAPQPQVREVRTPETDSAVSLMQKYVPKELMAKLEAARQSGTMAGERRVVTMLFCDVKGSTAAAEQLDPEDWTEIINGAFEHMIKPVYQYEGTVARLMGDGILAFFGAPIAHEDDPERAVLAGLKIVSELQPYREAIRQRHDIDFNVRVGINTGPVVVGAVGSDLRMEYTAMGDAINLAARMEQTAEPGSVRIAHDTYRLVSPLFDFEELGSVEIKGKDAPVPAYRVLGRKTREGHLRGIAGLAVPQVGRASEMAAFSEALAKNQKGIGGIMMLIGEAGLGKSRLIREAKAAAPDSAEFAWFETTSQSYETAQPYNLVRRLIRRVINAAPNDPNEVLRQKISTLSEGHTSEQAEQTQRVFESLFGLSGANGAPPLEGETFKQLFLTATRNLWEAQAARQPTVLVCDDLHWADAASIDLLFQLFELTESAPLMIVCSLRPERQAPGWQLRNKADSDYLHRYTELMLKPLSDEESGRLLDSLASGAEIPIRLRQRILDKAAGIPYYLEEVVRGLLDNQTLIRENGAMRWGAAEEITDFDLPDNLQSLLVARIDRLEEDARRTLQLASVVGRSFYYRVLARMGDTTRALDRQLDLLVRDNMIREAAREPELEYSFGNVLTQEAAYQTILLRNRRQFHRQVGEALEALYPERRDEMAHVLALHFSEAGDPARTLEYRTRAGDAASRMHALDEAVNHYSKALEIALAEQGVEATSEQIIHLFTRLGRAYENLYQFDTAGELYEQMRKQADARDDPALKLAYLIVFGTVKVTHTPMVDPELGRSLAQEALALASELGDRRAEARAHWNLLLLHRFFTGDMEAARHHGEISLEIARDLSWEEHLAFILNDLAFVYFGLFKLDKALHMLEEARDRWHNLGNLPMLTDNLNVSGMFLNFAGEHELASKLLLEGLQVAESIHNVWNFPPLYANLSDALTERGEFGQALTNMKTSLEVSEYSESTGGDIIGLSKMLQIYTELGLIERGLETCEQLFALDYASWSSRIPEGIHAAQARLFLLNNDLDAARSAIEKAHPDLEEVTSFPFVDHHMCLSVAEVRLALGEYDAVIALAEKFIDRYESSGFRYALANLYYFRGMALLGFGKKEAGRSALETARTIAEETGARRILWKILASLADLVEETSNAQEANTLRNMAFEIIDFIADHAGREQYRAAFLARPDVLEVLKNKDQPR